MKIHWSSLTAAVVAAAVARQVVFAQGVTVPQTPPAVAPNVPAAPYAPPPPQTAGPVADPLRQADVTANDFGLFDGPKLHNVVDVTIGSTFEFSNRATLGTGFAVPLTGPKPFGFEILAQLSHRC